jgi:hypothetical protein
VGTGARCPSCGTKLKAGTRCGACNADRLPVESIDQEAGQVVEMGARRRWLAPVVVGGLAVAIGAAAVLTGGSDGKATPPTLPPSTTTIAASTTVAPSTTTTVAPTTTTVVDGWVTHSLGPPLFAEPMADTLYATDSNGELVRIDLATGSVATRDVRRLADRDNGRLLVPAKGGVLLSANWGPVDSYFVPDGGPIEPVGAFALVATRSGDAVWQIGQDDQGRVTSVRLTAPGGQPVSAPQELPLGSFAMGSDGADGLVVGSPDGSYRLTPAGPRPLSTHGLVAVSGPFVLEVTCDAALQCVVQRRNDDTGAVTAQFPSGPSTPWYYFDGALSRDGRWYARVGAENGQGLVVFDLDTGQRLVLGDVMTDRDPVGRFAWSRDGRFLYFVSTGGALHAWDSRDPTGGELVVAQAAALPSLTALVVGP